MFQTKPINSGFYPLEFDICRDLKRVISNDDFCDLNIQVGTDEKTISAHRLMMAGEYFSKFPNFKILLF